MVTIEGIQHHHRGNLSLLQKPKVSIVGSRRPNSYTKTMTLRLASALASRGYVIVSGGAMGVDALAHKGAGASNTIAVLPSGIDVLYPAINTPLLKEIGIKGLLLSQFEMGFKPTKWSFVVRNKIVVALGEYLIITQADKNSGSMRSAEIAMQMDKKIYVLPHRIGDSEGTNYLAKEGLAEIIWDIDAFVQTNSSDPFIEYLKTSPNYDEAIALYGERIFEAEVDGLIEVQNMRIIYKGV